MCSDPIPNSATTQLLKALASPWTVLEILATNVELIQDFPYLHSISTEKLKQIEDPANQLVKAILT